MTKSKSAARSLAAVAVAVNDPSNDPTAGAARVTARQEQEIASLAADGWDFSDAIRQVLNGAKADDVLKPVVAVDTGKSRLVLSPSFQEQEARQALALRGSPKRRSNRVAGVKAAAQVEAAIKAQAETPKPAAAPEQPAAAPAPAAKPSAKRARKTAPKAAPRFAVEHAAASGTPTYESVTAWLSESNPAKPEKARGKSLNKPGCKRLYALVSTASVVDEAIAIWGAAAERGAINNALYVRLG